MAISFPLKIFLSCNLVDSFLENRKNFFKLSSGYQHYLQMFIDCLHRQVLFSRIRRNRTFTQYDYASMTAPSFVETSAYRLRYSARLFPKYPSCGVRYHYAIIHLFKNDPMKICNFSLLFAERASLSPLHLPSPLCI